MDLPQQSPAFLKAQEEQLEALRRQVRETKRRRALFAARRGTPVIERLFVSASHAGRPI